MSGISKLVLGLALALMVSGTAFAGTRHHKAETGKTPKSHHNPHKPGPASNAKPGGHSRKTVKTN
jgi:hypothetical protein